MAVSTSDVNKLGGGNNIPDAVLQAAIDDAILILQTRYSNCYDPSNTALYDLLVKYYAAHLLYLWDILFRL